MKTNGSSSGGSVCSHQVSARRRFDVETVENGGTLSDRGKTAERSMEDLTKSSGSTHSHGMSRAARALTVR